jgi:hypothetical protein
MVHGTAPSANNMARLDSLFHGYSLLHGFLTHSSHHKRPHIVIKASTKPHLWQTLARIISPSEVLASFMA